MKCKNKNCNLDANPMFGSGKFCSRACSNSRIRSENTKKKISIGVKKSGKRRGPLTEEAMDRWKNSIKLCYEKKYKSKSFDELSIWQKRKRILEEQNNTCADCALSEWKCKPISLEVDHKDGNTDNNTRENLWAICPNCHSTTDTWRGRNKPRYNGQKIVDDSVLLTALKSESSIRAALLKVGLAAKGGNYARAKKLLGKDSPYILK